MDKKTPNDYPQVKFRTGKDLEAELASRSDETTDSAYSRIAKRDLERYYAMMALDLPTFSKPEARLLVSVLNGSRIHAETVHRIYLDVDEMLEEHPIEGINRGAFVARLRNLSRGECMAIADAVERFWNGAYHKSETDTWKRLEAVGLIKGE